MIHQETMKELAICLGCSKPYTPDVENRGWCKFCLFLFALNAFFKVRPQ